MSEWLFRPYNPNLSNITMLFMLTISVFFGVFLGALAI